MSVKLISYSSVTKKQTNNVEISINGEKIERVYVTKFLGVMIDHKINWKEHIEFIKNILSESS